MNITLNGKSEEVSALTVSDLLKEKAVDSRCVVVEHNGSILKHSEYDSASIQEEDTIEVLRIVGGG